MATIGLALGENRNVCSDNRIHTFRRATWHLKRKWAHNSGPALSKLVKKFTTGKLPGIELETDEQERIELTKRLKMGDLPQDFDDDELDFIGSWNGDNGDGAFPNVKVLEIYDLVPFGTEPNKFTWPLFAEFLRSEKEEWEFHRPKGRRGHAQFALDVAIGDCFKAG